MVYDDYGELSLEHEYHNLGNDYYKINEFDKAIEHYNKALELRPDLLETYFNRGLAYTRKQMYDKALEDMTKVIELNPNLAEAYYTRGLIHEYKMDYERAIGDYDKALEVDPKYSKAETQRDVARNKKASIASGGGGGGGMTPGAPSGEGGDGQSNLTKFEVMEKPKMRFKDVAGLDKVKEKILEYIVYPLSNPELAKRYGKEAGGGVIMYGPPGCGKTFIAKASAGECAAAFISVKASDIVDMYAGNTEKNLHNAFETAREHKPCILFFDEIDGVAGKREGMDQSFEKRAINQFLVEMDGAEYSNEGVLAVGATNAPWDIDAALRRAGRFSRMIFIGEPDTKTRREIIKIHMRKRPVSKRLNVGRVARMTEGYSPADLAALVDAAATIPWKEALKTGKERVITFDDFRKASSGEDAVTPSLPAWYGSVKKKLIEEEDDDKNKYGSGLRGVFMEILDTNFSDTQSSYSSSGSSSTTVKHKSEQKELINEEERRQFSQLIKDIEKRTDDLYLMLKKMRTMTARYVM
ncbi:MAG: AAA family ATPase [Candidatus Altiarchaeota archaeon]